MGRDGSDLVRGLDPYSEFFDMKEDLEKVRSALLKDEDEDFQAICDAYDNCRRILYYRSKSEEDMRIFSEFLQEVLKTLYVHLSKTRKPKIAESAVLFVRLLYVKRDILKTVNWEDIDKKLANIFFNGRSKYFRTTLPALREMIACTQDPSLLDRIGDMIENSKTLGMKKTGDLLEMLSGYLAEAVKDRSQIPFIRKNMDKFSSIADKVKRVQFSNLRKWSDTLNRHLSNIDTGGKDVQKRTLLRSSSSTRRTMQSTERRKIGATKQLRSEIRPKKAVIRNSQAQATPKKSLSGKKKVIELVKEFQSFVEKNDFETAKDLYSNLVSLLGSGDLVENIKKSKNYAKFLDMAIGICVTPELILGNVDNLAKVTRIFGAEEYLFATLMEKIGNDDRFSSIFEDGYSDDGLRRAVERMIESLDGEILRNFIESLELSDPFLELCQGVPPEVLGEIVSKRIKSAADKLDASKDLFRAWFRTTNYNLVAGIEIYVRRKKRSFAKVVNRSGVFELLMDATVDDNRSYFHPLLFSASIARLEYIISVLFELFSISELLERTIEHFTVNKRKEDNIIYLYLVLWRASSANALKKNPIKGEDVVVKVLSVMEDLEKTALEAMLYGERDDEVWDEKRMRMRYLCFEILSFIYQGNPDMVTGVLRREKKDKYINYL